MFYILLSLSIIIIRIKTKEIIKKNKLQYLKLRKNWMQGIFINAN